MPIVTIRILEGRDKEIKKKLIGNVTQAIVQTLDAPPESVRVIIEDMPNENYGIAGLPVLEYRAQKRS
ncbi:MAG: 2-hydroxymuconate tautomerase [Candidatus Omnitrophota bacterium]